MKYLYNIILSIFLVSCNANLNKQAEKVLSGVYESVNDYADTIVGVVSIPESTEKEYFLIIQNDTSDFSLFVDSTSEGNIVATYRLGSPKYTLSEYLADSSAVKEDINKEEKRSNPVYSQFILELQKTLISASEEFELRKLQDLSIAMLDIPGFSENITKQYITQFGESVKFNHYCLLKSIKTTIKFIYAQ